MFKIECLCDDKRLPLVHRALDGLVYNLTTTLISTEPAPKAEKAPTLSTSAGQFLRKFLKGRKKPIVTMTEIAKEVVAAGWGIASANKAKSDLVKQGILSRTSKLGEYKINRSKL